MKTIIVLLAAALMSQVALAGDNGSYLDCMSASGKTQLKVGQVGSYDNDIAFLSIMGKTLGEMHVDSEVRKVELDGNITRFIELDHDGDDLLTIRKLEQTLAQQKRQIVDVEILSGYNANKMAPLDITIKVQCKIVYNPI